MKPLPQFDELPKFNEYTGCAWGVWGSDDQLGTVNLLTEEVVKRAAQEEIRTGKTVSLNWPINFPEKPLYDRISPRVHTLTTTGIIRDDEIHINTQSGTQWDGLKHFGIIPHGVIYNNTPVSALPPAGDFPSLPDPRKVSPELVKLGIHNWADHGICGRGVFLDLVRHYTASGAKLPYNPWSTHRIPVADLEACAKAQGVTFRPADVLLIRMGFIQKYYESSQEEKDELRGKPETSAGLEQSEATKRFVWDNHFAAVASDQPALEAWPPEKGTAHLHETFLGLFGMPIGEFFDLEKLSEVCAESGRYTFFFSSWPLNILGGCASPPNAAAYF